MTDKDLPAFGQKLRQLRKTAGLTQDELAEKIGLIHIKANPKTELRIDGNRISKWERAFKDKKGREWKPKRQHVLYLIEVFLDQLTLETAQHWALQASYRLDTQTLQSLFSGHADTPSSLPPVPDPNHSLKRLDVLPYQRLFGIQQKQEQLRQILKQEAPPWLVAIDGIGGIGKTSLANSVARQVLMTERFYDVAWVSAKQEEFQPGGGLQTTDKPALDTETLVNHLLEQLDDRVSLSQSFQEKLAVLTRRLKNFAHLIIVDNLETVADYQTLVPLLVKLANPSKILLTSRHSLHTYPNIFCLNLEELNQADTAALLQYEAEVRGIPELANASPPAFEAIYQVVGGNPLALKLVVGLIRVLPLAQVLENLKEAQGKKADKLYTYVYWQAWHMLDAASQQVLLVMPLAHGGTIDQLQALCRLEPDELNRALQQLTTLSLVQIGGTLQERRYTIHRLTESFLLKEAIKWQTST